MKSTSTNFNWKRVFVYFWQTTKWHKGLFWLVFVLYGAAKIIGDLIVPLFYRDLVDVISHASVRETVEPQLIHILVIISILIVSYQLLFRIADYVISIFQSKTLKLLSDDAFQRIIFHSYRFFSDNFAGSLVAKVKRYVRAFEDMHDQIVFNFWMTGIQLVGTFSILAFVNPLLGLLFFIWTVIYIISAFYFASKRKPLDLKTSASDSKVTAELSDVLTNILNVKVFSSSLREVKKFEKATDEQHVNRMASWLFQNNTFAFQAVMLSILEIGGMYFSVWLWLHGLISTGTIILVQIYIGVIFGNTWVLGRSISRFATALSEAAEMVEIFDTPYEVQDTTSSECEISQGLLIFDRVTFAYSDNEPVFSDFSLEILPGQKVGLVGSSGAGKSTIIKLLLRFFDIQKGSISIDGCNICDLSQDNLRSAIAYVPQEPILFHRTLRENIAYGRPDATQEQIEEAAKKAHAHMFISSFPYGYDTLVGERGIKLSGGERQRVAIARAMLTDSPILILDEATSSLDSESEKLIQDAFEELMRGRTTLVIAHRLSTIKQMDRILVLEEGRVVEDGTHDELLNKKGRYYSLWSHQQGGFIE